MMPQGYFLRVHIAAFTLSPEPRVSNDMDVSQQEKNTWQQLLYFKERFVSKNHPLRPKWEKYSDKLRKFGLHERMGLGPSKEEFLAMLEDKGLTLYLNRKRK